MRIVLRKKGLRRDWSNHPGAKGLLLERDLRIGFSRLAAKLLVFETRRQLREFWKHGLGRPDLGRHAQGAVNGMFCTHQSYPRHGKVTKWMECDPRYYCVIGLAKPHLTMEIICHEAVHAAFNYAKRRCRSPWDTHAKDMDEEAIAYPAGQIAREINRVLYEEGLWE